MALWRSWLARRPVTAEVAGSSPVRVAEVLVASGQIAQSVEHTPEKCGVASSILALATRENPFQKWRGFFCCLIVPYCFFGLMGTMTTSVAHQTDQSRFVITVDGEEAGFAEYSDTATTREFHHTEIYEAFQGQGLSKPLIKAALDDDSTAARQVVPTCSAVAGFIAKNPEYQPLTTREGNL